MCVAPDGTVRAGVAGKCEGRGQFLHVVRWRPADAVPRDLGPIAIRHPDYVNTKQPDVPPENSLAVYRDG